MAFLYVAEFSTFGMDPNTGQAVAKVPPLVEQKLANAGAAVLSSAFNAATRFVRLHTDSICSVAFGAAPVATTSNMRFAANQTEYFAVNAGDSLSVILNT